MARARNTPVNGIKLFLEKSLEAGKPITAISTGNPATVTITGAKLVKDDVIEITGLGELDGRYPVASATDTVATLCSEVDWSEATKPTDFTQAKAAKVVFHDNFCNATGINKSPDTVNEEDNQTICDDGPVMEPTNIERGNLDIAHLFAPDGVIQQDIRQKFEAKAVFSVKMVLTKARGVLFYYGHLSSAKGAEGNVGGKINANIVLRLRGRDYWNPATTPAGAV